MGMEGKAPEEALNGRVKYRGVDRSEVEVPFGEKDQVQFSNFFKIVTQRCELFDTLSWCFCRTCL